MLEGVELDMWRTVAENPEADQPRRKYAAWLRGSNTRGSERARFIELQLELARRITMLRDHMLLIKEEQALLDKYRASWSPAGCANLNVQFRRGFPCGLVPPFVYRHVPDGSDYEGLTLRFIARGNIVLLGFSDGTTVANSALSMTTAIERGKYICSADDTYDNLKIQLTFPQLQPQVILAGACNSALLSLTSKFIKTGENSNLWRAMSGIWMPSPMTINTRQSLSWDAVQTPDEPSPLPVEDRLKIRERQTMPDNALVINPRSIDL